VPVSQAATPVPPLERQVRNLRRVVWLLSVAVIFALVIPPLTLVRYHKSVRGRLWTNTLFARGVILQLDDGQFHHAALIADSDGTALTLDDNQDHLRSAFEVDKSGRPRLRFLDSAGHLRAWIGLDEHGNGTLELLDEKGTVTTKLPPQSAEAPGNK
jgi:hypothetical protein